MKWSKQGHIFVPNKELEWSISHAQVPVADLDEAQKIITIYFSTRNNKNQSLPSYIIVEADNPRNILEVGKTPILGLGELGTFDDCGVMPSWIINYEKKKYLYYIGWNVRNTIPYHNAVGLAISEDGGKSFYRFSKGPLWDRDFKEPHYSGTSCVLIDNGIWKNWYLSCTEWKVVLGKQEPRYHIKYAESLNGINWNRKGTIAIDYKDANEAGIVKASVLKIDNKYHMWFSYRNFTNYRTDKSNSYRIGYATSFDGIEWHREDHKAGIMRSKQGWDSMMTAYPHVIKYKNQLLMFYNGNGFGKSGFGLATLETKKI